MVSNKRTAQAQGTGCPHFEELTKAKRSEIIGKIVDNCHSIVSVEWSASDQSP